MPIQEIVSKIGIQTVLSGINDIIGQAYYLVKLCKINPCDIVIVILCIGMIKQRFCQIGFCGKAGSLFPGHRVVSEADR